MAKTVCIPWKAWYGDGAFPLTFPDSWDVKIFSMESTPDIGELEIQEAFENPIGTKTIRELSRGKKNAVIAVDDISRPTPASRLLPNILKELAEGGITADRIRIIMSLGAHRPMFKDDLRRKLGREIVERFDIYNHHPFENLHDLGCTERGTPVQVNSFFMDAELKIGVGCIIPHPYAGFGGGGKIVLPGLAGIKTLESNHRPVVTGNTGKIGVVEGNEARREIEEIAQRAGLDVIANVVVNSRRGIAGLFVGDTIKAHRAGVKLAKKIYATKTPEDVDVAILNAYPKDTELLQAGNAFNLYRSTEKDIVKQEGIVILSTACTVGRGYHSLHEPGMRLYKKPQRKAFLGKRKLMLFSPGVNLAEARVSFSEDVPHFRSWQNVIKAIEETYTKTCRVAVFPSSTLQLAKE